VRGSKSSKTQIQLFKLKQLVEFSETHVEHGPGDSALTISGQNFRWTIFFEIPYACATWFKKIESFCQILNKNFVGGEGGGREKGGKEKKEKKEKKDKGGREKGGKDKGGKEKGGKEEKGGGKEDKKARSPAKVVIKKNPSKDSKRGSSHR
jgi:hypothetical protein